MVIPVPATLPDSGTLAPRDIQRKFQSSSLAGLGDFCDEYPEECGQDPSYGGPVNTPAQDTLNLCAYYPTPGCPGYTTQQSPGTGTYGSTSSGGGGLDYNSILATLIKGGVDVAKLQNVTPGTTLSNSGAISRQNQGYAIPGSGVGTVGVSGGSSTMLMVLGVGALFLFLNMNKKGGN